MYISGQQLDFETRLHSLPSGMTDLATFKTESSGYWNSVWAGYTWSGGFSPQEKVQLNQEANRWRYLFSGASTGSVPTSNYF